jgi:hypothetical protein
MTERWETEIRKLRTVEPGSELGARFEEGPLGEPAPPTRQRVVAAVTALALFLGAGVFAVRVLGPGSEPAPPAAAGDEASLVLELSSNEGEPAATLGYADQEQDGTREGYRWCVGGECVAGIADFVRYPPVFELLVVPPSTPIEVAGDGSVERLRISTLDDESISESGGPTSVPGSNGTYVVQVDATWAGDPGGSANFFFGVQTLDSPASAPDVLRVECGPGYTVTDTAVVRTQADGLHVEVSGAEGIVAYNVVGGADEPEAAIVGSSVPAAGDNVMVIPPGEWEFACRERGGQDDTDPTASFELVDPDGNYASYELECGDGTQTEQAYTSEIPGSTAYEEAATQLVTGLQEGDRLRGAGYGAETWKIGPTYVVERGGDSVARLILSEGADPWFGSFGMCEGSGIGLSDLATPIDLEPTGPSMTELSPSPGASVSDVLGVRCEGLGPVVDSTQVRLQEDGLHVDAMNVGDAEVVEIRQSVPDRDEFIHQTAFAQAEESFIVPDVEPGPIWVGCRVSDETGAIVGGPSEVPEAYYVQTIEVLPAA